MLKKGKIHFFTGKGGVGKSLLSYTFAKELASSGQKTLWIEFSQNPSINLVIGELQFKPQKISENLQAATWNGEDCLQEFVKYSVKLRLIYETFYRSKAMTALIKAAPALREIAFLGYITSHLRDVKPSLNYDQIVVDAPSTGHFLSCLKVPIALLDVSDFGPMGFHCKGILEVLRNTEMTSIYNVFTSEPLVVSEYEFLTHELKKMNLTSKAWLNRALSSMVIQDLDKSMIIGHTPIQIQNLMTIKSQQSEVVKKLNLSDLIVTELSPMDQLNLSIKKIVQDQMI